MRLGQLQHKSAMLWHPASLLQSAALRLILLSLAFGSDNRLELESGSLYYNPRSAPDNPFTIILTIVASDSLAGIHRGSASVVITLAAINPPEVMVDIKPIAAILLTGTNAAATISISGGYLPAGGDYAITITSNVASGNDIGISITGDDITLLAITANNPQTITATIIADDNHNNVIPATGYATLTVQALPVIGLTASRLLWTITTEVSITALAAQAGINNGEIAEFGTLILAAGATSVFNEFRRRIVRYLSRWRTIKYRFD